MASAVNNLRVNNKEVRKIFFNGKVLKEFYYNNILVWKNANPFIFAASLSDIDTSTLSADTLIFTGFSKETFDGSYTKVENAEEEKSKLVRGQMVVETTDGEN